MRPQSLSTGSVPTHIGGCRPPKYLKGQHEGNNSLPDAGRLKTAEDTMLSTGQLIALNNWLNFNLKLVFTTYGWAGIAAVCLLVLKCLRSNKLDSIPTIGYSDPFLSYISAVKYIFYGQDIIKEGYEKHRGGIFKVPLMDRWQVVACGPALIDDIRKAPHTVLSFMDAANETIQSDAMLGHEVRTDPYHIEYIRSQLTRGLDSFYPEVYDEIIHAISDNIPNQGKDWVKVPALQTTVKIVSRVTTRTFVGLPLCRDPKFGALQMQFAQGAVTGAIIINLFPPLLRPLAAKLFTNPNRHINRAMKDIKPIYADLERQTDK